MPRGVTPPDENQTFLHACPAAPWETWGEHPPPLWVTAAQGPKPDGQPARTTSEVSYAQRATCPRPQPAAVW